MAKQSDNTEITNPKERVSGANLNRARFPPEKLKVAIAVDFKLIII